MLSRKIWCTENLWFDFLY